MKSSRVPNQSPITLKALLHRRKTTLEGFVTNNGIFTYELLCERCRSIGVVPPSLEEFQEVLPKKEITSPTEGIVVLPAPPVISEVTGEIIDDSPEVVDDHNGPEDLTFTTQSFKKDKRRR